MSSREDTCYSKEIMILAQFLDFCHVFILSAIPALRSSLKKMTHTWQNVHNVTTKSQSLGSTFFHLISLRWSSWSQRTVQNSLQTALDVMILSHLSLGVKLVHQHYVNFTIRITNWVWTPVGTTFTPSGSTSTKGDMLCTSFLLCLAHSAPCKIAPCIVRHAYT